MLVAPFVRESPDGVFIVGDKLAAAQYTRFLVYVEGNAATTLEHIIGEVHVGASTVVGAAVVFLQTEDFMFPDGKRVEHMDELAITQ